MFHDFFSVPKGKEDFLLPTTNLSVTSIFFNHFQMKSMKEQMN